ncbi:MAG TPA: FAD-dependent oxidoreductase [Allosphingosinicella sp.]|uniref:FAD-dependent oxidoreductase n=1 Tax=Allosphingosinicella sp. TaxID=2823234 RepID=UPI002EDA2E16
MDVLKTDLCIVGGGPAGMMAGLLFARAGVRTLVLEKHADFLRDFRGDTVHPSTLEIFGELGLVDELLSRPHARAETFTAIVAGEEIPFADFGALDVSCPFVALMPQWDFLDCTADAAREYPSFSLRMEAEVTDLAEEQGRVTGVRLADGQTIRARLVLAADGRHSVIRDQAGLPLEDLGAPMDVFWFRISKPKTKENRTSFLVGAGQVMALIDRGDYWQSAYVFPKGGAERIKAKGIEAFRSAVAAGAPMLAGRIHELRSWEDVKLLAVSLNRLKQWHRPGLLLIGDAAHAMSPMGGVGINLAIQDAVAAANILADPMAAGEDPDLLLEQVQERRMMPTRVIQTIQRVAQERVIGPLLEEPRLIERPPRLLQLFKRSSWLRRRVATLVGIGIRPESVRSPEA